MVSYSIFLSQKVNISKQKEALKYPALTIFGTSWPSNLTSHESLALKGGDEKKSLE